MKPFKFSLQSVLDYRVEIEEAKASVFQRMQQEVRQHEQTLEQLEAEQAQTMAYLSQRTAATSSAHQHAMRYQMELSTQILTQKQLLAQAMRKRTKAHQIWMLARQDVQVMEKLREKHEQAYRKEVARLEAKELEEYALMIRSTRPMT